MIWLPDPRTNLKTNHQFVNLRVMAQQGRLGNVGEPVQTYNRSPIVGRRAELDRLESIFRDVSGGQLQAVLVAAEAGGGKSHFVEEFTRRINDRGLVLSGECIEMRHYPLSLAPLRAILGQLVRDMGTSKLGLLVNEEDRSELAHLLPEFGTPSAQADAGTGRAAIFEVLRKLFEVLASERPLILVVEDAHWADQATADLLNFLVGRLAHVAVMLLVTYRPEGIGGTGALRTLVANVVRSKRSHRLELGRMDRGEVAAHIEEILQHQPSPGVVNAIYAKGGGVPLFTEALAVRTGDVSGVAGTLRDFLLIAISELAETTRAVLRVAALGGPRISHTLLARVAQLSDARLAACLRPAVNAGVLISLPDGYAFRHALIGDAVRSELLAGDTIAIHKDYATALEDTSDDSSELSHSIAVARHWAGAGAASEAVTAAWKAARQAKHVYAEQFEMLVMIDRLWAKADKPETIVGTDHVGLLELAVDAACWAAEAEPGLRMVEQALAEIGDETLDSRRAALLLQRALIRQQSLLSGEISDHYEAIRLAESHSRLHAEALGQTCRALILRGRPEEARRLHTEMQRIAEAINDREFLLEAGINDAALRPSGTRSAAFEQIMPRVLAFGSGRLEVLATVGLLRSLQEEGRYRDVASLGWGAFDRTLTLGQGRYMGSFVGYPLCQALLALGKVAEAADICERMAGQDPLPLGLAMVLDCRAEIALASGDTARAAQCIAMLRGLPHGQQDAARRTANALRLEIDVALAEGEPAHGARLAATTDEPSSEGWMWSLLISSMRAAVQAGDAALARELASRAERSIVDGPVEAAFARTFAAESLQSSMSSGAWQVAADAWGALGAITKQAYCLARCGGAEISEGKRSAGAASIRQAIDLAGLTDSTALISEIENIASRARVRLGEDGREIANALPHGLTERELEVLQLVAVGRSNREIASALFISPKTASVHVSNILSKLDAPTRNVAASMAHRQKIVGPL